MDREGSVAPGRLISVPKAARMLRLSIPYTQRLIRSGKIEGEKVGRTWFTSEDAVRQYMTSEETTAGGRARRRRRFGGGGGP
jgi:excisionase family DNA binding protein